MQFNFKKSYAIPALRCFRYVLKGVLVFPTFMYILTVMLIIDRSTNITIHLNNTKLNHRHCNVFYC